MTEILPTWATEVGATVYITSKYSSSGVIETPAKIIRVSAAKTQVTVEFTRTIVSHGEKVEEVMTYRFKASRGWKTPTGFKEIGDDHGERGLVEQSKGENMIFAGKRLKEIRTLEGTAQSIADRLAGRGSYTRHTTSADIDGAIERLQEVSKALKELGA